MDGYSGIKVRMKGLETWTASSFGQQLNFLKGKWHVYPARELGCGCWRAFKWSLANVFCAAGGNEIHASSVVTLH